MNDFALQRKNMVESQIRPSDVTDRRIMRSMAAVERERFVPEARRTFAYMDDAVPLGEARTRLAAPRALLSPRTFAKLLALAAIEDGDRVLVVGCGPGYSAAVIAGFAASVVAVESDLELVGSARTALASLPADVAARISLIEAPLVEGAPAGAPYDVIVIEGGVPDLPPTIAAQMADGGRCVGILVRGVVGVATLWRRVAGHIAETEAFEASAPLLPSFSKPVAFVL